MQRNEIKFKINNNNLMFFKNNSKIFNVYSQRKIFSIYFDTFNLSDFVDSEEGTVPRKKIRLRYYGEIDNNLESSKILNGSIEIKKTFDTYRDKKKFEICDTFKNSVEFVKNFSDKKRLPVCAISYDRNYYKYLNNVRITIDRNIKYYSLDKYLNLIFRNAEYENIVEMKIENINEINSLETDYLNAYRVRFSKYCEAIKKIKIY